MHANPNASVGVRGKALVAGRVRVGSGKAEWGRGGSVLPASQRTARPFVCVGCGVCMAQRVVQRVVLAAVGVW